MKAQKSNILRRFSRNCKIPKKVLNERSTRGQYLTFLDSNEFRLRYTEFYADHFLIRNQHVLTNRNQDIWGQGLPSVSTLDFENSYAPNGGFWQLKLQQVNNTSTWLS